MSVPAKAMRTVCSPAGKKYRSFVQAIGYVASAVATIGGMGGGTRYPTAHGPPAGGLEAERSA